MSGYAEIEQGQQAATFEKAGLQLRIMCTYVTEKSVWLRTYCLTTTRDLGRKLNCVVENSRENSDCNHNAIATVLISTYQYHLACKLAWVKHMLCF